MHGEGELAIPRYLEPGDIRQVGVVKRDLRRNLYVDWDWPKGPIVPKK
jgi:hypothetical protein